MRVAYQLAPTYGLLDMVVVLGAAAFSWIISTMVLSQEISMVMAINDGIKETIAETKKIGYQQRGCSLHKLFLFLEEHYDGRHERKPKAAQEVVRAED